MKHAHTSSDQWITARYQVRVPAAEIDAFAAALALEQSVEVPLAAVRDPWVLDNTVGRVADITTANGGFEVTVKLALATTGLDPAQTINMLFGNASLHESVSLLDAQFPTSLLDHFPKPRHGIAGIRALLGVHDRALTCAALKPQGLSSDVLAGLLHTFAINGVDIIKDDHGLADQPYSPFAERVRACQRALRDAQRATGRNPLYAPSIVGAPAQVRAQLRIAREEGVGMVLLAPALIGMPLFAELVAEPLGMAVLAHPAYAGATRVAHDWLFGQFFRLLGADAVIYPNFGGRFAFSPDTCRNIAANLRTPWHDVATAFPVPAGGITVERVPELLDFYGQDLMLLIGGSLLMAGDALAERTRAFAASVAR